MTPESRERRRKLSEEARVENIRKDNLLINRVIRYFVGWYYFGRGIKSEVGFLITKMLGVRWSK